MFKTSKVIFQTFFVQTFLRNFGFSGFVSEMRRFSSKVTLVSTVGAIEP